MKEPSYISEEMTGGAASACMKMGQHVAHIYGDADAHLTVLVWQITAAIKQGERIVRVMGDAETAEALLQRLEARVEGLRVSVKTGALVLIPWRDCAETKGAFDATKLIQWLEREAENALRSGFSALRFLLEMPSAPGVLDSRSLVVFETNLARAMQEAVLLGLCQFDCRLFTAELLLNVLRTHRQIIVGTELYDNFYFVAPGELLKGYMPDAELAHNLENLATYRHVVAALKESSSFVDNFHGIAFRCGMDFAPMFLHGSVEAITGYTEDEFLSAEPRWEQIIYPDDLGIVREAEDRLRTVPNYTTEREYRIARRDGQIRWIHEHVRNICDRWGTPCFVQGTLYDTTARKRMERALRDSEAKYRRIVELSSEGIWALDTERRTTFVNKRMADMLGYHVGEMIGRQAADFVFQEDRKGYEAQLAGFKTSGTYELRFRRRDGSTLWTRVSATPLQNENGRPLGAFAMFTDISDRHG